MTASPAPAMRRSQPKVRLAAVTLSVALAALGFALPRAYWTAAPLAPAPIYVAVIIAAGLVIARHASFDVSFRGERIDLHFAEVPAAFALVLLSPWVMAGITILTLIPSVVQHRSAWYKLCFNGALQLAQVGIGVTIIRSLSLESAGVRWVFVLWAAVATSDALATCLMLSFVRWASKRPATGLLSDLLITAGQSIVGAAIGTLGVLTALQHPSLLALPAFVIALIALFTRQQIADRLSYQDLVGLHGFLESISSSDPAVVLREGLKEFTQALNLAWAVIIDLDGTVLEQVGPAPRGLSTIELEATSDATKDTLVARISGERHLVAGVGGDDRRARRIFTEASGLLASTIDRADLQLQLDFDATHDPLTGLLARSGVVRTADQQLRAGEGIGAVTIINLTRFAEVNNTLGFKAGDLLLSDAATRLKAIVEEHSILGRLDGDSFVLFSPTGDRRTAIDVANLAREALQTPVNIEGLTLTMLVRIGIAIGPGHGATTEQLLRAADVAAGLAKDVQPQLVVYRAEADLHSESKLELLHRMRRALEVEEFEVWFQPKIDTISGLVVGAEALLRWNDDGQWIPPDEFIPAAEAAGMMNELTDFVLRRSLSAAASWRDRGSEIGVAVNLSPSSLEDPQLPGRIASQLQQFNVRPPSLTMEITESVVMGQGGTVAEGLERLRSLGVRLSVDDFGTGYSSLRYLKDLDVDELKLDRSFVQDLAVSDRSETIARAVVGLGHNLGLQVVAEGVETPSARELLHDMGCDVLQGFLIARPMPLENFNTWVLRYLRNLHAKKLPAQKQSGPTAMNADGPLD